MFFLPLGGKGERHHSRNMIGEFDHSSAWKRRGREAAAGLVLTRRLRMDKKGNKRDSKQHGRGKKKKKEAGRERRHRAQIIITQTMAEEKGNGKEERYRNRARKELHGKPQNNARTTKLRKQRD